MNRRSAEPRTSTVAVFAPLFPPAFRGGGPIRSIAALVQSAPEGVRAAVLTSDRDLGDSERLDVEANCWLDVRGALVYYASTDSLRAMVRALFMVRASRPRLLHLNSFMNPRFSILPIVLSRVGFWRGSDYLISPRGEFGDGALKRRSRKKQIYIALFRLLGLSKRVIWHSTAAHETSDIRRIWGPQARVIERENDTALAPTAIPPVVVPGPLRAVFLGRIVPHKGLDIALEAMGSVSAPIHMDVYGSREDEAYARRCEDLARALPAHVSVTFHGTLAPESVVDTLKDKDALLMPTAGENFGHVIAEALSASCAILVTPFTPWTKRLSDGGGVILERSVESWREGIQRMAETSTEQRIECRLAAGRAYRDWFGRAREAHVWSLALGLIEPHR